MFTNFFIFILIVDKTFALCLAERSNREMAFPEALSIVTMRMNDILSNKMHDIKMNPLDYIKAATGKTFSLLMYNSYCIHSI